MKNIWKFFLKVFPIPFENVLELLEFFQNVWQVSFINGWRCLKPSPWLNLLRKNEEMKKSSFSILEDWKKFTMPMKMVFSIYQTYSVFPRTTKKRTWATWLSTRLKRWRRWKWPCLSFFLYIYLSTLLCVHNSWSLRPFGMQSLKDDLDDIVHELWNPLRNLGKRWGVILKLFNNRLNLRTKLNWMLRWTI